MATEPVRVVADRQAVRYTGMNSGEIAAIIDDFTVVSEAGGLLTFTSDGTQRSVVTNGWITYWEGAVREDTFANDDDFEDVYRLAGAEQLDGHVHDVILTSGPPRMPNGNGNG